MTGVNLSKKMPKGELLNGLHHLAERMARGSDTEYVLLAVVPARDIKPRGEGEKVIEAVILGVEPLVAADHRRDAERLMREARLARRGHEETELPIPE